jgi:drug/metabolite transporter (DMT)-like permease
MKYIAVFMGLAAGVLFGIATPISKIILEKMNSFQLAGLLYLGAAIAFLPYVLKHRKRELQWIKTTNQKKAILGIVVFGGMLGPLFLMIGLKVAASSSVSIWLNMELVATAILGVIFFKDHLDKPAIIGVLLTIVAGVIVSLKDGLGSLLPAFFVTLACFSWGIDNHLTAIVDGASPKMITFIKGLFAGSTNLLIGSIIAGEGFPILYLGIALLVGVVSYGLSIVLYVSSAQQLGATRSQILFSTGPFWGILVAFLILGEPISAYSIVAMVLLAIGILFTNLLVHDHSHRHMVVTHVHLHYHDDGHHEHEHDAGIPSALKHSHLHTHEATNHTHKHYPDLHHRHEHIQVKG